MRTAIESVRDMQTVLDCMRALAERGWSIEQMRYRFRPICAPTHETIEAARAMLRDTDSGEIAPENCGPTNAEIAAACGHNIKTVRRAMAGDTGVSKATKAHIVATYLRLANA